MRELVLVHGRAQEHRDAIALKREWLDALHEGLRAGGLELPIPEERVRFPFYGDTLFDLVSGVPEGNVAEVVVRGNREDPQQREFMNDVLEEVRERFGIRDDQVAAEASKALVARGQAGVVVERGPLNWGWVQGILSAIDRFVPGASGASIALFTRDVYLYLNDAVVAARLENGVRQAMTHGVESVVVSHSLGTVVAYNMLRREGAQRGWRVPLFVTLGSPLAVTRIRKSLAPIGHPDCVGRWFNAMDPDDVVSLYPLDGEHFPIAPPVENKTDVDNDTSNQHGIRGYLRDPEVARRIHEALMQP